MKGPKDKAQEIIPPENEDFTGFVFKNQANLDPKQRDHLTYFQI